MLRDSHPSQIQLYQRKPNSMDRIVMPSTYEGDPGIGVRRPINAVPILKFISFLGACV